MSPSAATFLRSCRAHSSCTFVLRSRSSPALRARLQSEHTPASCQRRYPLQQQQQPKSQFSTSSIVLNAQPIQDITNSGAAGQEIKGSDAGENIAQSVLSRASTEGEAPTAGAQSQSPPAEQPASSLPSSTPSQQPQPRTHTIYPAWSKSDAAFVKKSPFYTGRVSRTGTMSKTVRVSRNVQVWDKQLQKYYTRPSHALVHDPEEMLNEGDVIQYGPFPPSVLADRVEKGRVGKDKVTLTVLEIVTPFGETIEQRTARKAVEAEVAAKVAAERALAAPKKKGPSGRLDGRRHQQQVKGARQPRAQAA